MPTICISGVIVMNGFLLVALNIPDHALKIGVSGEWLLDNRNVIDYATNKESPVEAYLPDDKRTKDE